MQSGDLQALRCADTTCKRPFDVTLLESVLPKEKMDRWHTLSNKRCLAAMSDVCYCPRCEKMNQEVPCIKDPDHFARCGQCEFVFCAQCRQVYHPGEPMCNSKGVAEKAAEKASHDGAAKAELLTLKYMEEQGAKTCPNCQITILRTAGCNKMRCQNCDTQFCWKCSKVIDSYDHFKEKECRLFDEEEILRFHRQVEREGLEQALDVGAAERRQQRLWEERLLQQYRVAGVLHEDRAQNRQCPRCKAGVRKENRNNHLRCHSCNTHFCGMCMVALGHKPGEHFNRKSGCPQHSD